MGFLHRKDYVEVLKPSDAKYLFEKGELIDIISKGKTKNPIWKIRMDDGAIEYCEENFLQKTSRKEAKENN